MKTLTLMCLLVSTVCSTHAQESECITPENEIGMCSSSQFCLDQLRDHQDQFQKQATCSVDNKVMICCNTCTTPKGENGVVRTITMCPPLMDLFKNRTYDNLRYIKKSRINSKYGKILVCCHLPVPQAETHMCDSPTDELPTPGNGCCGVDTNAGVRIVGGESTSIEEYPWTVILRYKTEENREVLKKCGGSLISNRYVLTAAHCITTKYGKPFIVRVGDYDSNNPGRDCVPFPEDEGMDCTDGARAVSVETAIVHPDYNRESRHNDIGLLRLATPVKYTEYVRPICLPTVDYSRENNVEKFVVAGWGRGTPKNRYKQAVALKHVNLTSCSTAYKSYRGTIWGGQICAGGDLRKDSCNGDSGGPLMASVEAPGPHMQLAGVVSYGPALCGTQNVPGVYTNVYRYLDWIRENLKR